MAYDENLARRIGMLLGRVPGLEVKKMFGGVCYLYRGNMVCGVNRSDFIVRVGPQEYENALARPHAGPFAPGKRKAMTGWVTVEPEGVSSEEDLGEWIRLGLAFGKGLPPKQ